MLTILEIIAFELVGEVSINYDKNTCDRPPSVKKWFEDFRSRKRT